MPNLEIEYKTLLNQDEYDRLVTRFSHVKAIQQTNYYFETTNGDLRANRMSLRIRTLPDRAELTLKIPQTVGNNEHNEALTLKEARDFIKSHSIPDGEVKNLLLASGIDVEKLVVLGNLTTLRRETRIPIGLLAIDFNQYGTHRDFELELEVTDSEQGKKDFDQFLIDYRINFKYAKSKVARFTATLKEQRI